VVAEEKFADEEEFAGEKEIGVDEEENSVVEGEVFVDDEGEEEASR
jgi:hypothetical protein